jgi:hypothetical protein
VQTHLTIREENMHSFRLAFVGAFAETFIACNIVPLHAAPLPTSVSVMKSMAAERSVQVRWGYSRGGWRARSWERTQEPAAYAFEHSRPHGYRWRHWRF